MTALTLAAAPAPTMPDEIVRALAALDDDLKVPCSRVTEKDDYCRKAIGHDGVCGPRGRTPVPSSLVPGLRAVLVAHDRTCVSRATCEHRTLAEALLTPSGW